MAKREPLGAYIVKPERDDREVVVHGLRVLYQYEEADYSVGLSASYWVQAVEVDGKWFSTDAFADAFIDIIADAIGDAVREEAAEDFDIPEEA